MKVLISKPGLDGHDRGAKVVARAFEEAGAEVVYTGLQATPEEIAEIARREQVDVVGVSLLSGAHNTLMPRVIDSCKEKGLDDVVYLLGGIIPQEDVPALLEAGVERVFGPGSNLDEIVNFALERMAERAAAEVVSAMGARSFNL